MPNEKNQGTIDYLLGNFKSPAMGNQYEVNFHCPPLDLKLEGVRCTSVNIPGRTVETQAVSEYGKERYMPTGKVDDGGADFSVSFICDNDFEDRLILQAWTDFIANTDTGGTSDTLPQINYYKDYIGRIEVYHLRKDTTETMKATLEEAFPVSFDAIALSNSATEPLTVTVKFQYRYFTTEYVDHKPMEREEHPVYDGDRTTPNGLNNRGRNQLNGVLEAVTVASRFNNKSRGILNRLSSLDTALSQARKVKRNFTNFRGRFGG